MCHGHWKSARDKYVNTVHLYAAKLNMFSAFRIILEVMTLLKQYHMPWWWADVFLYEKNACQLFDPEARLASELGTGQIFMFD